MQYGKHVSKTTCNRKTEILPPLARQCRDYYFAKTTRALPLMFLDGPWLVISARHFTGRPEKPDGHYYQPPAITRRLQILAGISHVPTPELPGVQHCVVVYTLHRSRSYIIEIFFVFQGRNSGVLHRNLFSVWHQPHAGRNPPSSSEEGGAEEGGSYMMVPPRTTTGAESYLYVRSGGKMPKSPRALYLTLPVPTFHPPLTKTVTRTPCE